MGDLRVRRVTPAELDRCHEIRRVVFIEEQQVPLDEEIDGRDAEAFHFLAEWRTDQSGYIDDGWTAVGTCRVRTVEGVGGEPVAKAERVAVLAGFRGRGVGVALMEALEEDARRRGLVSVKLGSQESAVGFYEKLGYRVIGEPFMDAGIPHRWMSKDFAASC
ncbi:MAG: GNAT family N-acetyltransferase [Alphaproteobacteria bacterium]|nr:GNAT family N-acetyltransferase [Alphaproteobacteria bacterium]